MSGLTQHADVLGSLGRLLANGKRPVPFVVIDSSSATKAVLAGLGEQSARLSELPLGMEQAMLDHNILARQGADDIADPLVPPASYREPWYLVTGELEPTAQVVVGCMSGRSVQVDAHRDQTQCVVAHAALTPNEATRLAKGCQGPALARPNVSPATRVTEPDLRGTAWNTRQIASCLAPRCREPGSHTLGPV